MISFGSRNYPINIVPPEDAPDVAPEDAPKKKKHRKRSKPAPKPAPIHRYENIVSPYVDGLPRFHQAGQPILPRKLLHLAEGCMLALQEAILKLEGNLLKDKNPNYPMFNVKVSKDLVDFIDEAPADLFFISYEYIFKLFHNR